MTLAADCFRCPGSRCPDSVREGCRRFVDLKAGVGPRTPYMDVSGEALQVVPEKFPELTVSPCFYKWPLTT